MALRGASSTAVEKTDVMMMTGVQTNRERRTADETTSTSTPTLASQRLDPDGKSKGCSV
jgi:hypothetical protein